MLYQTHWLAVPNSSFIATDSGAGGAWSGSGLEGQRKAAVVIQVGLGLWCQAA
jgi:hypothetical protein